MIKKLFYTLLCYLTLFPFSSHATADITDFGGIIYIDNATAQEVENLFIKHKYTRFRALDKDAYPAIFVRKIPSDFDKVQPQKYRNELFIRILAPLALKINEELVNERNTLLRIERNYEKNHNLTEREQQKLEEFAIKYDAFTREKGEQRIKEQIKSLKRRIDVVPPSILITAAAIESNWGTARTVKEANSLYKEKVWYTTEGLEPLENKEDGYRFKIFDSLIDSMRSFALTFNSNINYEPAWSSRVEMRNRLGAVLGESLAYTLAMSSKLPNFAGITEYTTAYYDLFAIDIGHLKKGLTYDKD